MIMLDIYFIIYVCSSCCRILWGCPYQMVTLQLAQKQMRYFIYLLTWLLFLVSSHSLYKNQSLNLLEVFLSP